MTAIQATPMTVDEEVVRLAGVVHLLRLAEAQLRLCKNPKAYGSGVHYLDAETCRLMAEHAQHALDGLIDEAAREAHPAGTGKQVA